MTRRGVRLPHFCEQYLLVSTVLAALALPAQEPSAAPAQQSDSAKTFVYDVVSVKPHKAELHQGMWWKTTSDGFSASGVTPELLVIDAYGLLTTDQIVNLPAWASADRFDIEAKMDEETAAAWKKLPKEERREKQEQLMQSLLADRFQFKVRHETRELPIYQLTVAKGGIKMKASPANGPSNWSMGGGKFSGKGIPLDSFVYSLSNEVGRVVVNKTGQSGNFEIDLKWTPDEMRAAGPSADAPAAAADTGPSIFSALEEQLGLKLVSTKGPVDVIVVERIEKPSEN